MRTGSRRSLFARMFVFSFAIHLFHPYTSSAQGFFQQVKEGGYVGFGFTQVQIGGDFDGQALITGGGSSEILPDLNDATGQKFIFGYQLNDGVIEFSYSQSDHDGAWLGIPAPAEFRSFNIDGKRFFFKDQLEPIAPLFALGIGFQRLKVDGGSVSGSAVEDATFKGWSLGFGGGVELAVHEHFAIDLIYLYRWGRYTSVDAIASGKIEDTVAGNGSTVSRLELKYIF